MILITVQNDSPIPKNILTRLFVLFLCRLCRSLLWSLELRDLDSVGHVNIYRHVRLFPFLFLSLLRCKICVKSNLAILTVMSHCCNVSHPQPY